MSFYTLKPPNITIKARSFPRQINQLFLSSIIFANSYLRGLNFVSFRVWNFEFCGIFWRRRGWGMSRARRIIFA